MNITNSTIIEENKENLNEAYYFIIGCVVVFSLYWCYCTPSKEESDRRFKWGVERAKSKIALRNELSMGV